MPTRRASPVSAPVEDRSVADRLHSAAIHLLRWLRREDDRSGLSAPRLSALSVVVFGGPLTLGELAAAEQVRPPTMTRLVAALEADELVARTADPADGRVWRISATAKGRRVLAAGRARRVATLAAAIEALDRGERDTLARAADIMERLAARGR
jgi:DNA-binding MarR family transcriptional regulator